MFTSEPCAHVENNDDDADNMRLLVVACALATPKIGPKPWFNGQRRTMTKLDQKLGERTSKLGRGGARGREFAWPAVEMKRAGKVSEMVMRSTSIQ